MSLTLDDVIRYLEGLPAEELGALADEVLRRLGMAQIPAPERPWHATAGVPWRDDDLVGVPTFDVQLRAHGADKLAVVRITRRALGPNVGLAEVKRLVESAPVALGVQLRRADAVAFTDELRRAGADAEVA